MENEVDYLGTVQYNWKGGMLVSIEVDGQVHNVERSEVTIDTQSGTFLLTPPPGTSKQQERTEREPVWKFAFEEPSNRPD